MCLFRRVLLTATVAAAPLCASTLNALYWAEGSTDSAGAYHYEAPVAGQNGSSVFGVIPTNASQSSPDNNVVNFFRTVDDLPGALAAYNGILLGDVSSYIGLTATFNISNSALPLGTPFSGSDLVGEMYPGQTVSNAGIRLMFMGGYYTDPVNGVTPNEWWSNPAVVYVTSMRNGENVTLTVAFDPALWSNYYGHAGTESSATLAQFQAALSGVTRTGLSFGSGYFFSDGFAFSTGGSAQIQVDDFSPISASDVPEPGTFVGLAIGLIACGFLKLRYDHHAAIILANAIHPAVCSTASRTTCEPMISSPPQI